LRTDIWWSHDKGFFTGALPIQVYAFKDGNIKRISGDIDFYLGTEKGRGFSRANRKKQTVVQRKKKPRIDMLNFEDKKRIKSLKKTG